MRVRVRVTVKPSARRERIEEVRPGVFGVSVREKPERGEANERVRVLLSLHFHVPLSAVRFVSGARGKHKTFDVIK